MRFCTLFCAVISALVTAELAGACGKWYRFRTTANRGGAGSNCGYTQYADLYLMDNNNNPITSGMVTSITASPTSSPPSEDVTKLLDANPSSKYLNQFTDNTVTIVLANTFCVTQYRFVTANDEPCRDPVTWTLQYSTDGVTWTLLDSRSNMGASVPDGSPGRLTSTPVFQVQSLVPSRSPTTSQPSKSPTTPQPSTSPTTPTTHQPSVSPSIAPSLAPSTPRPSSTPTTSQPSESPSVAPSAAPTTSSPSSAPTTPQPSAAPSTSTPSNSPSFAAPLALSASVSNDLGSISVDFDKPVVPGVFSLPRVCEPDVVLQSDDTGCGGASCSSTCAFASNTRLVVTLSPRARMRTLPRVLIAAAAGIVAVVPESEMGSPSATADIPVQIPAAPETPTLDINGPRVVSTCSKSAPSLQSVVSRVSPGLTFAWLADGAQVDNRTTHRVMFPEVSGLVKYEFKATTWIGQTVTSSPFFVNFTTSATASVFLLGNSEVAADAPTLLLQGLVSVPLDCFPPAFAASSITYDFTWTLSRNDTGQALNLSTVDVAGGKASTLSISPPSLLIPGVSYRAKLAVATGIASVTGEAEVQLKVLHADPIMVLNGSSTIVASTSIVSLFALRSCDPNNPLFKCTKPAGAQVLSGLNGLTTVAWLCRDSANDYCMGEGFALAQCTNSLACSVDLESMSGLPPYVVSLQGTGASGRMAFSNDVTIVPQKPDCPLPDTLQLECVRCADARVNNKDNVTFIATAPMGSVTGNSTMNRSITWELKQGSGGFLPLSSETISLQTTRLPLTFLGSLLVQGASYTLRFTNLAQCGRFTAQTISTELTFTVNAPPTGGALAIAPMTGNVTTWFSVVCSDFTDVDLPLTYAIYRERAGATYVEAGAFQADPSRELLFPPSPEAGHTIRCLARDALLASTEFVDSPAVAGVFVEAVSAAQALLLANNALGDVESALARSASPGAAISVISNVASLLTGSNTDSEQRTTALNAVFSGITRLLNGATALSSRESQQVLNVAGTLASAAPQTADSPGAQLLLSNLAGSTAKLLSNLKGTDGENLDLDKTLVSASAGTVISTVAGSIVNTGPASTRPPATRAPASSGRRLDRKSRSLDSFLRRFLSEQNEETIMNLRKVLRDLGDVLLAGIVDGEAPLVVPLGVDMKLVAVVSTPNAIGQDLSEVIVPGFNASIDPSTTLFLPRNVLQGVTTDLDSKVNIVAVRFRFNVRELVQAGVLNYTLDPLAPAGEIEEVLALDFQRARELQPYHPSGLEDPIRIRMPLAFHQLPKDNTTQLACGFWHEIHSRWSSEGCNVTNASLPMSSADKSGWIECSCNHASDYAAWEAFVQDVNSVFTNPFDLKRLSTIAALVCGVLLPSVVLFWMVFARIGRKKDLRDARLLHLGTFVSITSRKIQLHERQRRFFKILRNNKGLSAKKMVKLQRQQDENEQRRASEQGNVVSGTEKDFYLKSLLMYSIRLVAVSQALAGVFFVTGVVVRRFGTESELSLTALTSVNRLYATTQALGGVSVLMCWSTAGFALAAAFRDAPTSLEFRFVEIFLCLSLCVAMPAMIVPLANGVGIGTGLGLFIAGVALVIANALLGLVMVYIRTWGADSKTIFGEFIANCGRGLVYEQSLVSILLRFDPFLDREKRFSLFVAIVVGNLFVGSFFFAIKTANDISLGLTIGTIILSAFVVAFPVKLTIRFLFKVTSSRTGSAMDRAVQIFRIIAFSNDVHPAFANEAQKLDVEMLHSFRRFYVAKHQVRMLEEAYSKQETTKEDLERVAKGLAPKGTYEYWLGKLIWADVLAQFAAAALFIAGAVAMPFASSANEPDSGIKALISFCVIADLSVAALGVALITGYAHTPMAPKLVKALGAAHGFQVLVTILAVALPFGRDGMLPAAGLELVGVAAAISWATTALACAAFYIYYKCSPELKSIRRLFRAPKTGDVEDEEPEVEDLDAEAVLARVSKGRMSSSARASSRLATEAVVAEEIGSFNPIARKEVSDALKAGKSVMGDDSARNVTHVDRRTGEFGVSRQLPRGVSERLHSKRLDRNVSTFSRITSHSFLEQTLKSSNGVITQEVLATAKAHLDACKKELRRMAELSRAAWRRQDPTGLTAKQLTVRSEQSLLLKLATVLAEETGPRPMVVRRWLPDRAMVFCWALLFCYYLGGLVWIAFWIFSRDAQSRQSLINSGVASPTDEQVAENTNLVLTSWLGASFFAIFIGYFVAEPVVIVLRYGIIPMCLRLCRGPVQAAPHELVLHTTEEPEPAEDIEQQGKSCLCSCWTSSEKKEIKHYKDRTVEAAFFDAVTDFVQAIT